MPGRTTKGLVKIGETDLLKRIAKEVAPPTEAQKKLLEAAVQIRQNPDAAEAAFMARQLVQCTLPHSNPGDVPAWSRRNGNLTLGITPGWDFDKNKSVGYPFGSIPRLLLFWVTTEALRTGSRRLKLGHSLTEFIRAVGLSTETGRGKRGDATRLREQMRRLFAARISFNQTMVDEQGREGERWLNMEVAPQGELWWDPKKPAQAALWESWIELGEKFYQAVTLSPVPVDLRALKALKRSPLALDLYAWATFKTFTISKKGETQFISWTVLMQQLGADYDDSKDLKKKARAALRKVQAVYPGLKIRSAKGGFYILPGKPAIEAKPSKRNLPE